MSASTPGEALAARSRSGRDQLVLACADQRCRTAAAGALDRVTQHHTCFDAQTAAAQGAAEDEHRPGVLQPRRRRCEHGDRLTQMLDPVLAARGEPRSAQPGTDGTWCTPTSAATQLCGGQAPGAPMVADRRQVLGRFGTPRDCRVVPPQRDHPAPVFQEVRDRCCAIALSAAQPPASDEHECAVAAARRVTVIVEIREDGRCLVELATLDKCVGEDAGRERPAELHEHRMGEDLTCVDLRAREIAGAVGDPRPSRGHHQHAKGRATRSGVVQGGRREGVGVRERVCEDEVVKELGDRCEVARLMLDQGVAAQRASAQRDRARGRARAAPLGECARAQP